MEFLLSSKPRCVLFLAIGGGGDVATTAMLALAARRLGLKSFVASFAWERFVVDPVPGPIHLDEIIGAKPLGSYSVLVDGGCYAVRCGRKVVFQAANASKALGEGVAVVDLYRGVRGVVKGIEEVMEHYGCDKLVAVDVGGDSLATGFEEELWSPLADFIGVVASAEVGGILAVHSPGADGELPQNYVLRRISMVAERGGYIWARGVTREDIEALKHILSYVVSEASSVTLLAYAGSYGYVEIRKGSRRVYISPLNLVTFFLDSRTVAELNPVANAVKEAQSLEEARKELNKRGIFTELDLEEEVYKLIQRGVEVTADDLLKIKRSFREKLSKG